MMPGELTTQENVEKKKKKNKKKQPSCMPCIYHTSAACAQMLSYVHTIVPKSGKSGLHRASTTMC